MITITIHRVLFSAMLAGCIAVLAITHWITPPTIVLASTQDAQNDHPGAKSDTGSGNDSASCSLNKNIPESVSRWCGLIETEARKNNLDAGLIAAIIYVESGGNPKAYSGSGAAGLMQVMPSDGIAARFECINGPCFAHRPTTAELFDPSFNITYGTHMLAGYVNRYSSIREGLKAYGPMDMGYRYADLVLKIYNQ
jgi:soluble lytic murein transglycosylase-like protein